MNSINYISMIIDGQSLLLPEDEVRDIVPIGNISHQQQEYPVYFIDGTLTPLDKCPEQRQFVVCFSANQHMLGVACDMVTSRRFISNLLFEKMPEMMRLPNSPIQALLYAEEYLHYVTAAEPLVNFLVGQEC